MAATTSNVIVSTTSKNDNSSNSNAASLQATSFKDAKTKQESAENLKPKATTALDFFKKLGPNVLKKIGADLETPDLRQFSDLANRCKPIRFIHNTFKSDIAEREFASKTLLPHVFNANPEGIKLLFEGAQIPPKLFLTKTSYREGYFSNKENKFICFRHWKRVSALQAAFLCGDGPFLGRELLAYILRDHHLNSEETNKALLAEVRQQLEELLDRKAEQLMVNNSSNSQSTASSAGSAAVVASTSTTATTPLSVASPSEPSNKDTKEKSEQNHRPSTSSEKELADFAAFIEPRIAFFKAYRMVEEFPDSAEFLAPRKALIKAYDTFIAQPQFDSKRSDLWKHVGECQKRSSHCLFREFCGQNAFAPLTEITLKMPPQRSQFWGHDRTLLDLDTLGEAVLIRTAHRHALVTTNPITVFAQNDLAYIRGRCEFLEADLKNTIDCLKSLESTLDLINGKKMAAVTLINNDKMQQNVP